MRNRIYTHLFDGASLCIKHRYAEGLLGRKYLQARTRAGFEPAILSTCRLLRADALPLLFSATKIGCAYGARPYNFIQPIPIDPLALVQHVTLGWRKYADEWMFDPEKGIRDLFWGNMSSLWVLELNMLEMSLIDQDDDMKYFDTEAGTQLILTPIQEEMTRVVSNSRVWLADIVREKQRKFKIHVRVRYTQPLWSANEGYLVRPRRS